MHVNPAPAHVRPYLPSLYLPGSLGRYRQYPRVVDTPIPGAGYKTGKGVWGEQLLYLGGYGEMGRPGSSYPYGSYSRVPLRGLGQVSNPWYTQGWVWGVAGAGLLVLGIGSYLTMRKLRRNRRRGSRRLGRNRRGPFSRRRYSVQFLGTNLIQYKTRAAAQRNVDRYRRGRVVEIVYKTAATAKRHDRLGRR